MKKLLGIVVLGLLLCSNAFAESEKCKSLTKYSNLWYYNKCDEQKSLKSSKVKTCLTVKTVTSSFLQSAIAGVNPTLHHNKPRTTIPKSFFI